MDHVRQMHPSPNGLPAPLRRTLLVAVAVIGSNAPDLDLLVSMRGASSDHLGYMLWHHRAASGDGLPQQLRGPSLLARREWLALRRLRVYRRTLVLGGRRTAADAAAFTADARSVCNGTHRRHRSRRGFAPAFVLAGQSAARHADRLATTAFAQDRLIDHVLSPMPANPLCWDMLLLETQGDRYIARRAVLSIASRVIAAADCPAEHSPVRTAPLSPVFSADSPEILWLGEFSMSDLLGR
jgi:hypothetical protein